MPQGHQYSFLEKPRAAEDAGGETFYRLQHQMAGSRAKKTRPLSLSLNIYIDVDRYNTIVACTLSIYIDIDRIP